LSKDANPNVFWVWKRKRDPARCDIRFSAQNDWQTGTYMELGEALEGWFRSVASPWSRNSLINDTHTGSGLVNMITQNRF
jgi:hypothetical protein